MNIDDLVNETIYFCKYFEIIDTDNNPFIEKEIAYRLGSFVFVDNLIKIIYEKMQLKKFISISDRKHIEAFLTELENVRTSLFIDENLEKIN